MSTKANPARDAYAFSLRGVTAINSYAFVPAIADDAINPAIDQTLTEVGNLKPRVVERIEDFLSRHFAPGLRKAA